MEKPEPDRSDADVDVNVSDHAIAQERLEMTYLSTVIGKPLGVAGALALSVSIASAGPSAEVAKRCVHYAYIVYPFKRPGAAPMSGDRQAYIKDCFQKNGDVPAPNSAKQ